MGERGYEDVVVPFSSMTTHYDFDESWWADTGRALTAAQKDFEARLTAEIIEEVERAMLIGVTASPPSVPHRRAISLDGRIR